MIARRIDWVEWCRILAGSGILCSTTTAKGVNSICYRAFTGVGGAIGLHDKPG